MFNFNLSYRYLHWRRPTAPPPALPENLKRIFITTENGPLELLYAPPTNPLPSNSVANPIFFAHGGMGSAWVFVPYMQYLSQRGIPCYAISYRGHGQSWYPGFLRMVYGTTRGALAEDLAAGIKWVQKMEGREVVLVGHSSGGGLSQRLLSDGQIKVKGLVLMAAVPGFGSHAIYLNWFLTDPLFTIRMLFHFWHPNSPLSHPNLTKRIFFSAAMPDSTVLEFQKHMCPYESFLWPMAMMRPFVNFKNVVKNIIGWGDVRTDATGRTEHPQRILVLAGGVDRIMTYPIMRQLASTCRDAYSLLAREKKIEAEEDEQVQPLEGEGGLDDAGNGVRFCLVPNAGHHLQNDIPWKVGAAKLLRFYQQL